MVYIAQIVWVSTILYLIVCQSFTQFIGRMHV